MGYYSDLPRPPLDAWCEATSTKNKIEKDQKLERIIFTEIIKKNKIKTRMTTYIKAKLNKSYDLQTFIEYLKKQNSIWKSGKSSIQSAF